MTIELDRIDNLEQYLLVLAEMRRLLQLADPRFTVESDHGQYYLRLAQLVLDYERSVDHL